LAAEQDPIPLVQTLERFAVGIGLIPEQIWDQPSVPVKLLSYGGPTGAALPLIWAHAEYIKLSRSIADGRVFDRLEPVASRYLGASRVERSRLEVWSRKRQITRVAAGSTLRVVAGAPFDVDVRLDKPQRQASMSSTATGLGVWYVDIHDGDATS